ncbi:MAG: hypothetical protein KKB50_21005 [Planctomycetes bacterium]|nr:hypothetical protein [Planctomycetota bacterium]
MSFMIIAPKYVVPRLQTSEASIHKSGNVYLAAPMLEGLGIATEAVVLVDLATRRIAIRRPRDNESAFVVSRPTMTRCSKRRMIRIEAALTELGTTAADAAGRYSVERHDDLLILNLGSGADQSERADKRG